MENVTVGIAVVGDIHRPYVGVHVHDLLESVCASSSGMLC